MTAAALEGHRAKKGLLAQELAPQQQLLQGKECPTTTTAERRMNQNLLTIRAGNQRLRLAWAQVNMQRGKTSDLLLAGIAAASGFQRHPHV